jgi:hypothetical protein
MLRNASFQLVLSPAEKTAPVRLAERDGSNQASIIRRLVRRKAQHAYLWFDDEAPSDRGHSAAALGQQAEGI